jgi:tripartite-type tricarboxylate transporter receptor subunit TctC
MHKRHQYVLIVHMLSSTETKNLHPSQPGWEILMIKTIWRMTLFTAWASTLLGTTPLQAQSFPIQPITLVVGYAPGGSVDLVARAIAPGLSKRLGQPVNVSNVAGASGAIAAIQVALSEPTGYTLLLGSPAEVGINHLTSRSKYDPLKDTTPIALIGSQPMVLVASKRVPVATVDEFLAYSTQHPGATTYASSGMGTPLHLAGETVKQKAGVDIKHIPYRGAGPMLPDVLGGQVDYAVMVLSSALKHINDGRIKALGLTQNNRSAAAPTVPALGEHPKLKGVDIGVWFGVLGPAKMPPAVVTQLRAEIREVLKDPALRKKMEASGLNLAEDTDFVPFLKAEVAKFKQVVEFAGIRN